ncbi:hypothetical protein AAA799E16_01225 [Marine Group I thaumarchaeote SCGC AAA799-E16]|uniref:Uncharacterized protein n=4 Tax=Marine Group I TaxID=905826 RepID=A0A087S7P1_9ARCH|nr:hypothetical protein AAA799N04_00918 [Marine Group I thaumarchaeote SCGC AAA799-N04]KER06048.1 hypothetical protein AAA799E16_01225 [Marine Group I thaumarchaeote SCGC AAA799-E16]KFM18170.1 hypothetical protein SCCGRSA3_01311 [Marine Group I thaumarchaeote SCGC RSA3]KFM21745.1 hypothetical protein AAA799B03_00694 [Marine Group I thaumarchaeote SCGC AAA799-B03]
MRELPEKFPEYSMMYKTITNQIKVLEEQKENASKKVIEELDSKITKYQEELDRIKKMFPDGFFEN